MQELGKVLSGLGLVLILLGAALIFAGRLGMPLGKLPGDLAYRGKNVSLFLPLGTSLLLSILLSAVLYLISRFHR